MPKSVSLRMPSSRTQHVAGLDVAMHDSTRVRVREGVADGGDGAQDGRVVELPVAQDARARSWPRTSSKTT